MDESQRSAWYRENGVYPTELEQWKHNAIVALTETPEERASPQETRDSRKRIKELERDLRCKGKALAETGSRSVLSRSIPSAGRWSTRTLVEEKETASTA